MARVSARRILEEAAKVIETRGWCRRRYETADGRVCASMAMSVAMDALGADYVGEDGARRRMCREIDNDSIVHWNDKRGRTKDEVLAAFRQAAQAK